MMQPTKSFPEIKSVDRGGTMTGIYPTENKFAAQHKKLVRMLTVVGYLLCVSLAAILLTLYYLFLWNPDMSKELPSIRPESTKELCSPLSEHPQRLLQENVPAPASQVDSSNSNSDSYVISDPKGKPHWQRAYQDDSKSATSGRRAFIPYPATVARDLISSMSNLPAVRESLDVSLNPPAYDINANIQTLSSGSSNTQSNPGSTESLYHDPKRSSSGSQENSHELLT